MASIKDAIRICKRIMLTNLLTNDYSIAVTPLLSGKHGIGKSQVAKSIAKDLNGTVMVIEGGTLKEGEITGIPYQYKTESGEIEFRFLPYYIVQRIQKAEKFLHSGEANTESLENILNGEENQFSSKPLSFEQKVALIQSGIMTDEELSTAVYNRMLVEQDAYKKRLLKMNPEEILNHAYEYSVREDILCAMEGSTFSGDQAYALLGIESPLKGVYDAYQKIEFKYIDEIYQSLEDFASAVASEHASLRNLPVYPQSFEYAQAHDEVDKYRLSFKANVACAEAIERAISQNYAHNCMDCMASKQVVQNFGFDRTLYVLANTVQLKDWDARFSWLNKEWAKQILIPGGNDGVRDHRWRFVVGKSHPGLTDMFLTMVRHDHEESCKQRASVRDQLKSHTTTTPQKVKEKSRKEEVR